MRYLKSLGLMILTWLGLNLVLTTVWLYSGKTVTKWTMLISLLLVAATTFLPKIKNRQETKIKLISFMGLILSVLLVVLIASLTKDFSWDGQSYHQEALLQLKNGWNPIKENDLYQYLGLDRSSSFRAPFWITHYPQGLWYLQVLFFDMTGNIESGKAVNMLLMIALFSIAVPFFAKIVKKNATAIILSLIMVINPVLNSQVFTFYNDGTIFLLISSLVILSLAWFFEKEAWSSYLPSISSVIVILVTIKFTALGYTLIIILLPLCLIVKEAVGAKNSRILWGKKYILAYIVVIASLMVGVLFVGKSSYVNNMINYGHPFYPLAGEGKVDIMSYNYVDGAEEYGRIDGLYISQISEVNNQKKMPAKAKFPLSVKRSELKELTNPDTRIGGFGPLFGAALIVFIFGLASLSKKDIKKEHYVFLLQVL